jgi:hypothetical protein
MAGIEGVSAFVVESATAGVAGAGKGLLVKRAVTETASGSRNERFLKVCPHRLRRS